MQERSRQALQILAVLQKAGFAAYLVGGCVRDLLLDRPVHDWDITTCARPEEVLRLFPHTVPTGLRHGTVTVLLDGASFEVTTFRTEGAYRDGRHPDGVQFVPDLASDLARRDFTINAMAMDAAGSVTDLFGGQEDLKRGKICCVGEPERRFYEDALRMLRAVRFSAQLGFSLEARTERALHACAQQCGLLSRERIRDEVEKTLLSPRPERLEQMIRWGLLTGVGLRTAAKLSALATDPPERELRWARWKLLQPELDFSALRLEKRLQQRCTQAALLAPQLGTRLQLKRAIASSGWETARLAARLAGQEALWQEIAASGECVRLDGLAVRGSDLPGPSGRETGRALQWMLSYVLEHPDENERAHLLSLWQARQNCHTGPEN